MYCYVCKLQTVGGYEPSLSHLWLCTWQALHVNTLQAVGRNEGTVLCIAMCASCRQLEGMSHLSLTCGCAHGKHYM